MTSFTPTSGVASTVVAVTGTNFDPVSGATAVRFNESRASSVTAVTAMTLNATVPANTGSGRIRVVTANGSGSSATDFIIPPSGILAADMVANRRITVLRDAGYSDEAALRDWLTAHDLPYAVGIRPQTAVWWAEHQPAKARRATGWGRPRTRVQRDARHQPISVAKRLPTKHYRTVTWREGTNSSLRSRFARVRVSTGQGNRPRGEEWLLIEWPAGETEPTRYSLSTLAKDISLKALVDTVKMRWCIELDYRELKQELGLGHYEGRNWRGFHHHASLCIAAYGFLMRERLSGVKKNTARLKTPAYPSASARAGRGPIQRHVPWSIASVRFRLGRVIARTLAQCPCCGKPRAWPSRI